MITTVFGKPGVGKTAFLAYQLQNLYFTQGLNLLDECRDKINAENLNREHLLTLPTQPPIFSDFGVKFLVDYEEEYEPYYINGYYFGMQNKNMQTQFLPPCSKLFLSEGQRYFDSRKSKTFPAFVSAAFEMHRHYGLDIWIDVQRPKLIDANIRELCKKFIEVIKIED